jgi:chemotaxis protein methyltransferase CheR
VTRQDAPAFVDAADVLEVLLGFRPEPTRRADVEAAVHERIQRRGVKNLQGYALLLSDPEQRNVEARSLADLTTVNETYFFREPQHHEVLRDMLRSWPAKTPLRLLSLGCSTGEEPYSIALTMREAGLDAASARVHAVDVSPAVIARAERACYSSWALRNVSDELRARYFVHTRAGYVLAANVRDYVRFEVRNVLEADGSFWQARSFDAIFCRNMLIYLTPRAVRTAIERCAQLLVPGGHLFLGHSETNHANKSFVTRNAHGAFYFVRQAPSVAATSVLPADAPARTLAQAPSAGVPPVARGTTVRDRQPPQVSPLPRPVDHLLPLELWQLWREERFKEARLLLAAMPETSEITLLRAALLAQEGQLSAARDACSAMLSIDPASVGAHHLLGLVSEQLGDLLTATHHQLHAAALDPDFALPNLRAGILFRRLGELPQARERLRQALRLLPYQSERNLLLFAGGFSAASLLALCRSELMTCGGTK